MQKSGTGKAFLVAVQQRSVPQDMGMEESLDELAALVDTAGAEVVGQITQRISTPNPDTFVGEGKLEEIKYWVNELDADMRIFDDELSPCHQRQLERYFGSDVRVIDRTALILDIFAQHARSREGVLQVSLAQYEYRLPRLTRMWTHLARQAGRAGAGKGAGSLGLRGPGETQLETDRREIRRYISHLKRQLVQVRAHRRQQQKRRSRNGLQQVALVGYTNAGKSTLLNSLSGASVYVADKLFATLDPTTRRVELADGHVVLVSDTVGFIQKLPHQLVAAFRSTLEVVTYADLLVHVVDCSHPQASRHIEIVDTFLKSLLPEGGTRVVLVLNKSDLVDNSDIEAAALFEQYPDALRISAATGEGLPEFNRLLQELTSEDIERVVIRIPYAQYNLVSRFYEVAGDITQQSYDEGVELCGNIRALERVRFDPFLVR